MTAIPTSAVLDRAADLIEERGWATGQGWNHGDGAPLCLEGAIGAALGVIVPRGDAWFPDCAAAAAMEDYLEVHRLYKWNDRQKFDEGGNWIGGSLESGLQAGQAKVIEVLRAAALVEAARERATHPALDPAAVGAVSA